MRESEKREMKDQELIETFLKREHENFGQMTIEERITTDGQKVVKISNRKDVIERKEHTFPEHLRKDGD